MFGLGLDLATKKSGWFLISDEPTANGSLKGQGGVVDAANWIEMARQTVLDVIVRYTPQWVALEDTYLNTRVRHDGSRSVKEAINPETRRLLDNLAGYVIVECHTMRLPVYRGSAAAINAACGIAPFLNRQARKKDLRAFAERLGYLLPQDACDALAVAYWGLGEARKDQWLRTGATT